MNREALKKGEQEAEWYKQQIYRRTKIKSEELVCPREQSGMTPCIARDGKLAVGLQYSNHPICVGCEIHIQTLVRDEQNR